MENEKRYSVMLTNDELDALDVFDEADEEEKVRMAWTYATDIAQMIAMSVLNTTGKILKSISIKCSDGGIEVEYTVIEPEINSDLIDVIFIDGIISF